jgi:hypothetical protein
MTLKSHHSNSSGRFRGVSVVSIETPFVPAYSVIDVQLSVVGLSKDQEKLVGFLGLFFLEKLLRDMLWLTFKILDRKRIDRRSDLPFSSWRLPGMGMV